MAYARTQVGTPFSTFTHAAHARHLLPAFYGSFAAAAATITAATTEDGEDIGAAFDDDDNSHAAAAAANKTAVVSGGGGGGGGGGGLPACARVAGTEGGLLWFGHMPTRCEVPPERPTRRQ